MKAPVLLPLVLLLLAVVTTTAESTTVRKSFGTGGIVSSRNKARRRIHHVVKPTISNCAFVVSTTRTHNTYRSGIRSTTTTTQPLARFAETSSSSSSPASAAVATTQPPPAPVHAVQIYPDADQVGAAVRAIVRTAAKQALEKRGHFALAIPGGSILKMLVGTGSSSQDDDDQLWTAQTTLAYVNHKCVAMDDVQTATHAKACNLFLKDWNTNCNILVLDGTNNGPQEATSYQDKLQALSPEILPRTTTGESVVLPVFDLALIGVGDDGHIGSLYPNRPEVLVGSNTTNNAKNTTMDESSSSLSMAIPWVLSVDMKSPPSITLSLPVLQSARQVVVAACGVSEKYPLGKSDAMERAICNPYETLQSFPAVGLRSQATWILDQAAASQLGPAYLQQQSSTSTSTSSQSS